MLLLYNSASSNSMRVFLFKFAIVSKIMQVPAVQSVAAKCDHAYCSMPVSQLSLYVIVKKLLVAHGD